MSGPRCAYDSHGNMQLPIGNLYDLKQCEYHAVFKIDVTDFVVACFPDDELPKMSMLSSVQGVRFAYRNAALSIDSVSSLSFFMISTSMLSDRPPLWT
jgi:hypothetical protein